MLDTQFTTLSIRKFNQLHDTKLKKGMTFDEAMNEIEANKISYFYTSSDDNDVLEAIKNEQDVADSLNLELIFIDEIGIYIAIY